MSGAPHDPSAPALEASSLHRSFGRGERQRVVLEGASCRVERGQSLAILGRSGDGKTTLLRSLGLLDRPDSGVVRIEGVGVSSASERVRARARAGAIGFVFQSARLVEDLTAAANVHRAFAFGPSVTRRERGRAVTSVMGDLGLDRVADRPAKVLSGGERQRVALARALVRGPKIVLADEPTGSLDGATGDGVVDLLRHRVHRDGVALVVVTHDRSLAGRLDDALELVDGRLRAVGVNR